MAYEAVDPGIVGQSYEAPMLLQDAQRCINFYCEMDKNQSAKEPLALLGCPGLSTLLTTTVGTARGCWVLPGGQTALWVTGASLYLITITVPATINTPPVMTATLVGTLLTTVGVVVMRDNGALQNGLGGYCLIVDGSYGYYYLLSGVPYTNLFTGALTAGSYTIVLPGELPNGLIISNTAILSGSGVSTGAIIEFIDTIGLTITMSAVATATEASANITLSIPVFGQITDTGFLGSDRIAFIEGFLVCNLPGTRTFFCTGPGPYSMLFPGLFFALKDSSTDNLVTLYEENRELWLLGERSSEVWFNNGGANFPFQRIPGVGPQIGCSAKHSITRIGNQLAWLGGNEQGENMVICTNQYSWERISTHAVEHAISSYLVVNDAIGYGYEEEGHLFYMLIFPTADKTWCFDFTSGVWHERLSYDPAVGVYHRHRSNCFMNFGDTRIVGDYLTGNLMQMSRKFFTDNGAPLRAVRRTPHVWQKPNRERLFFSQLQVEFTPGVGLQGSDGTVTRGPCEVSPGYLVSAIFLDSGCGGEGFVVALQGSALSAVWSLSFTDSSSILRTYSSSGATPFISAGYTYWAFPTLPTLVSGTTYPLTITGGSVSTASWTPVVGTPVGFGHTVIGYVSAPLASGGIAFGTLSTAYLGSMPLGIIPAQLGVIPQVMLRWSNDGGFTWSNEHWASIGRAGQTKNRAMWRQLGQARDRVWEVVITDPVQRDIIGATLFAEASM
jgi:hypothetical protein